MTDASVDQSSADPPHAHAPAADGTWTVADAMELYGTGRWGQGYFSVNDAGNVDVHPTGKPDVAVDLKLLVDQLRRRGLELPLLIRFSDILGHRVANIHSAFDRAITELEYRGDYRCVYPIKVNQQRHVVEEIHAFGKQYGFGLEVGSKPELLAVLGMVDDDQTPIICNGFKDSQFIEAVIVAAKLGRNIIPVVEKMSELPLIVKHARHYGVSPSIGIRVKLACPGAGRWEQSGGTRSKFGLFVSEVLEAVAFLKANDMLDCLRLLHVHVGSQIDDIRNIKAAITELARVYTGLKLAGADLQFVDVGGGLGVDYDGSNGNLDSSINYTLQEYANDVVFHIGEACDQAGIDHPTILSESGRAMVAYHSVLVCNVLGSSGFDRFEVPEVLTDQQREDIPAPIVTLFDSYHDVNDGNFVECYHDTLQARDQTLNLFSLGYCTLEQRGLAERLFFGLCSKVYRIVRKLDELPEEFAPLETLLADTYFCNYSVFQSVPDSWAIDQLFPIMPIHRLDEEPTCRGVLGDMTCDSDGRIDSFVGERGATRVLPLHPVGDEDYLLGTFLVGAYQETLGDLHNLFGDTNAVHVSVDDLGRPMIDEVVEGDTVREVLHYVQYSADELLRNMRRQVEHAVRDGRLNIDEWRLLLKFYETSLEGHTYLQ